MRTLFPILTLLFFSFSLMAQVGINNANPYKHSVLDLKSTTKGLLIPRLDNSTPKSQIDGLKTLLDVDKTEGEGMLIWGTVSHKMFSYNSSQKKWQIFPIWEQSSVEGSITTSNVVKVNTLPNWTLKKTSTWPRYTGPYDPPGHYGDVIVNSYAWSIWHPKLRSPGPILKKNKFGVIVAEGISAEWYGMTSDERIKDIIGRSNSEEDLSTLFSVEVTDYKMKDKVKYGEKTSKKVIAQQLKTVYPKAVSLCTKFVPNIYKLSEIKEGYIALKTDLKKGDKIKLFFDESDKVIGETVEVFSFDKNGFTIDNKKEGKVFVYGKEVDDFHIVDYDAVAMLNVSATQELYKLILKQQKIIEQQKTEIKAQPFQMEEVKKSQSDFERRINNLENSSAISK